MDGPKNINILTVIQIGAILLFVVLVSVFVISEKFLVPNELHKETQNAASDPIAENTSVSESESLAQNDSLVSVQSQEVQQTPSKNASVNTQAALPPGDHLVYENSAFIIYTSEYGRDGCTILARINKLSGESEALVAVWDCGETPEEIHPLHVYPFGYQYNHADRSTDNLQVTDLNTMKKYVVFTPEEGESLRMCTCGPIESNHNDISYLGNMKFRVGIYKYYKDQFGTEIPRDDEGGVRPEKIRDEIVDISELYKEVTAINM